MPGNISDSDDATAQQRGAVGAFSRWIVLRSPASHERIEAWRAEGVESMAPLVQSLRYRSHGREAYENGEAMEYRNVSSAVNFSVSGRYQKRHHAYDE